MENELTVFENTEFGQVRVVEKDGEPWFIASDVCNALEISNSSMAVKKLDDDERAKLNLGVSKLNLWVVNEPGLYALVLGSRKPEAKVFKRWIAHEVVPSIRKHGGYIAGQENMTDDELMARALMVAQNKIADRDRRIAEQERKIEAQSEQLALMAPKVKYADEVLSCPNAVSITVIAKDYGWTGAQMNKFLHDQHVQYKSHSAKVWVLYDKYAREGYTSSETGANITQYGTSHAWIHTKWTQKGRMFIYELMKKYGYYPICER